MMCINVTKEWTAHQLRYNVNYCKIIRDIEHVTLNIIFVMEIVGVDEYSRLLEIVLIARFITQSRINGYVSYKKFNYCSNGWT